jgi:hypothetical protein
LCFDVVRFILRTNNWEMKLILVIIIVKWQ